MFSDKSENMFCKGLVQDLDSELVYGLDNQLDYGPDYVYVDFWAEVWTDVGICNHMTGLLDWTTGL